MSALSSCDKLYREDFDALYRQIFELASEQIEQDD